LAWVVVAVVAPVALFALHRATRGARFGLLRRCVLTVGAFWMLLPAPVPGHPGHHAPAWIVFLLEWGFQRSGQPATSAMILSGGTLVALAVALVWWLIGRRRPAAAADDAA
jgi:hypothetical protein